MADFEEKIVWHEVVFREPTEEEKEAWSEYSNVPLQCVMACKMPDDGDEVLVLTKHGAAADICVYDDGYYLENIGEWDNVVAWAEVPTGKVVKE